MKTTNEALREPQVGDRFTLFKPDDGPCGAYVATPVADLYVAALSVARLTVVVRFVPRRGGAVFLRYYRKGEFERDMRGAGELHETHRCTFLRNELDPEWEDVVTISP